jgi:hypothetical protein
MQKPMNADEEGPFRVTNPVLDFWIRGAEAQLKAWQAYQVEGARFVAKRMHSHLEFLRSLGHCGDASAVSRCQLACIDAMHKDYAEEAGRILGTTAALALGALQPVGAFGGQRNSRPSPESGLKVAA